MVKATDAITIGHELGLEKNSLITYLLVHENPDGSFGPYANEYGTKIALEALALIKDDLDGALKERVEQAITKAVAFLKSRYPLSEDYSNSGFAAFDA